MEVLTVEGITDGGTAGGGIKPVRTDALTHATLTDHVAVVVALQVHVAAKPLCNMRALCSVDQRSGHIHGLRIVAFYISSSEYVRF